MAVKVIIPGEPKAKARPRMSTKTGRAYTPQDTVNYENWVKLCYQDQGKEYLEGELVATINAYYGIPKSTSKKKTTLMLNDEIKPTKKPDLDNIVKAILDSLNGLAYKDDSQVVKVISEKFYSEQPRVELILNERS